MAQVTTAVRWGATLIVVAMWTAVSIVAWPRLALHLRLRSEAAVAQGEVVNVDARDHNRATYHYTVAGRDYANSEVASRRRVGQKVRVYYMPEDPSVSMLRDPASSIAPDVRGLLVLYVFIAVGVFVVASRSSRETPK